MTMATFIEARLLAEGRRQAAQRAAEVAFNTATAALSREHATRYAVAKAAYDDSKAIESRDAGPAEAAFVDALRLSHELAKVPVDERPIFAARQKAYDAADAAFAAKVKAAGARHEVITG